MRYYCTYFDRNYLLRGLTLYQSLKQHAQPFILWVLCFDEWSFEVLTKLAQPDLRPVALADFESGDSELLAAKSARSKVEYYFTCSPSWPLYLLTQNPEIDLLTYLDADLYFFSSPEPIFAELSSDSILIVGHRFPDHLRHLELHGIYNVGLLTFRSDDTGRACLRWWRERCLEWCGIEPQDGKFADQKYLDDWPERFPGTRVLEHAGAGLAPWNWTDYTVERSGSGIKVNGKPLIFYHYHGIKFLTRRLYDPVTLGRRYGEMPPAVRDMLYRPYVAALKETAGRLRQAGVEIGIDRTPILDYGWRMFVSKLRRRQLMLDRDLY